MRRRPDRLNRVGLALLGLLLAAAGGYGLARGHGALGSRQQHDPVLVPGIRRLVADDHRWFWWAAAAASLFVALVALAWLRAQLRLPRPANDDLTRTDDGGTAVLRGGAAADALAAEVDALPGVASADARLWGDPSKPAVYLRVQINDDAPIDAVRTRIETESLDRLRQALQVDAIEAELDLRLAGPQGRTVL